jgi:serine/threonine protein kinase
MRVQVLRVFPEPTLRVRWDTDSVYLTGPGQDDRKGRCAVWIEVSPSLFPHEHEGLKYVRERLPEKSYWAWSNFTLVTGRRQVPCYEVDLLVLAPSGLYLVELKAWTGPIRPAGPTEWWIDRYRRKPNPIGEVQRKAQVLRGRLERANSKRRVKIPWIIPAVFLHNQILRCHLPKVDRAILFSRDDVPGAGLPGIMSTLTSDTHREVTPRQAQRITELLEHVGITERRRMIGNTYELGDMVNRGPGWQEHLAHHERYPQETRRIKLYYTAHTAAPKERARLDDAADREFQLRLELTHPGAVTAMDCVTTDFGPALVYPFDRGARRLDTILDARDTAHAQLSTEQATLILRRIAEVISHTHGCRTTHAGLSPRSVFVLGDEDPTVQVTDWQTASIESATSVLGGTSHIPDLLAEEARLYCAPELFRDGPHDRVRADVFSLGVIAYRLLGGRLPGTAEQLGEQLSVDGGLRLDRPDVPSDLTDVIFKATQADVNKRLDNVEAFLTNDSWAHPADATPGTVLKNRWRIARRLGSGSCSYALLVEDLTAGGARRVMKIARTVDHNDWITRETATLSALDHPGITKLILGPVSPHGDLKAAVTEFTGEETLDAYLRRSGPLSGNTLRTWGAELLAAAAYLNDKGVAHRDIKPANISVRDPAWDGHHLVLFDFSHSDVPPNAISAGTSAYLDPFLCPRSAHTGIPQRRTTPSR